MATTGSVVLDSCIAAAPDPSRESAERVGQGEVGRCS